MEISLIGILVFLIIIGLILYCIRMLPMMPPGAPANPISGTPAGAGGLKGRMTK